MCLLNVMTQAWLGNNSWTEKMAVWSIFGYVLLVSSVCVDFVFSASDSCTLKVFEEQSADHIEDLCLEEFKDSDCRPFLKHFNRSDLPAGFPLSDDDDSVQRPESVDLTSAMNRFPHEGAEYFVPAAYVNWNSPVASLSRKNVKGYLLTWNGTAEVNGVKCRLFKFNASRTDLLRKKLRFQYFIEFLKPNQNFMMKVYSMPPPENLEESQKVETFFSRRISTGSSFMNYLNPGNWSPSLSTRVLKEGAIEVKIGHSPSRFNLTQFKVMLVKRSVDENNVFKTILYTAPPDSEKPEGLVSFANLTDDEYKIVVRVIDPFHKQDGKCLCWVKETNGRHCRISCGSTATTWFNVSVDVLPDNSRTTLSPVGTHARNGTSESTSGIYVPGIDTEKMTGKSKTLSDRDFAMTSLIIGIMAGAVVIVAVALLVVYTKHKKHKDSKYSLDNESPKDPQPNQQIGLKGKAPPLKHKTILIVSTEDNPAHTRFVEQLAMFLKTHCMCYVMNPPWERLGNEYSKWVEWSRAAIDAADKILLVDSVMAENLLGSFNQTKIFMNDPSTSHTNQMFKLAQDYIWAFPDHLENFIMLHYREECGSWQHLKAPIKIQLPGGFPQLLRSVHKLTEEEAKAYTNCLPLSLNYETVESGISSELLSALLSAQRPYLESYISSKSDDTGIGSDMDNISTASSVSSSQRAICGEIFMGVEADSLTTPSEVQVMSYPLQGESPSELNSEYNLDERSVFTVAVDPLIKSRENPDKMEFIPPEPINLDGRSFTSALYNINKDDDDLVC